MKTITTRTVLVTWVAIAVLVGATLSILTLTSVPSERLYDSIVDGDELGAAAIVFVRWATLTFLCGAPLSWALMELRARFVAGRLRRGSAEEDRAD
ncbi:MAG TPA: hypothetical protein VLC06_07830 [Polyangia bacterium]|jgi:hypothetical protein|nr:hypothetical protein [Polyangia bacterium]